MGNPHGYLDSDRAPQGQSGSQRTYSDKNMGDAILALPILLQGVDTDLTALRDVRVEDLCQHGAWMPKDIGIRNGPPNG